MGERSDETWGNRWAFQSSVCSKMSGSNGISVSYFLFVKPIVKRQQARLQDVQSCVSVSSMILEP